MYEANFREVPERKGKGDLMLFDHYESAVCDKCTQWGNKNGFIETESGQLLCESCGITHIVESIVAATTALDRATQMAALLMKSKF